MLKNISFGQDKRYKKCPLYFSQTPTHHSFTFNLKFLCKLKHKVRRSKCVWWIFHYWFRFVFIKACVHYFHQIFIFYEKRFLFDLKSSFRSPEIQSFVFLSFPLFLPVGHCFGGWSKINLKVHDVINCLNKNSITHFVWYLEKEKRYDIETLSINGVSDKEHFYRKIIQKMCSKS